MKTLLLLLALTAAPSISAQSDSVQVGMPEAKLIEIKGAPQSKAAVGKKAIYRWPDMQVTLVDGKVEQVQHRDRIAERQNAADRAAAEARKQAAAKEEARQAKAQSRQSSAASQRAANTAEDAEERRLTRAVYIQQEISSIERQLAADSKSSSFKGPPPLSSETRALLNVRLEKLRAELAGLR